MAIPVATDSLFTTNVTMAWSSPARLLARHSYSPSCSFPTPSSVSIVPLSPAMTVPMRYHMRTGRGSPVTAQVSSALSPSVMVTVGGEGVRDGGTVGKEEEGHESHRQG